MAGFKWDFIIGSDGQPTEYIACYPSDTTTCVVVANPAPTGEAPNGFATLSATTDFHDGVLMQATGEINRILRRALKEGEDRNEAIHILLTPRGPLLAWVHAHVRESTLEEKANLIED